VDAVAAAVICLTMYVFICFMNIWHAGWSIGPRYLAVIVPFMGWGALVSLDAVTRATPRLAAVLGIGCAAAAVVAAGVPSVYYPHLPPEMDWPLAHLLLLLIRHDYAPLNAANLLGWYGSASMVPLFLVTLFALGWAGWTFRRPGDRAKVLAGAALVGALLLTPHFRAPPPDPAAKRAVAFITRTWHPEGHDRAARLSAELDRGHRKTPERYRQLAAIYEAEGRMREARAATHQAGRMPVSKAP
jgi:hypothetical protein